MVINPCAIYGYWVYGLHELWYSEQNMVLHKWDLFWPTVKVWEGTCFVGSGNENQSQSLEMCSVWNNRQYVESWNLVILNVM